MNYHNHAKALITVITLLAVLSGCSLWPPKAQLQRETSSNAAVSAASGSLATSHMPAVASDFVKALRQIPTLAPALTTINLLGDLRADAFTGHLARALDEAGYAVRWVGDTGSAQLLLYRREYEASHLSADRIRYDVAVDNVELRRSYLVMKEGGLQPVTPLYVKGADASLVVLDDAAFDSSGGGRKLLTPSTLAVPADANPLRSLVPATTNAKPVTLPLIALPEIQNVFELGGSNYKTTLAEHQIVAEQILTFPNDSLRLGQTNKRLIERLVEQFDPDTDLFSIIGCSLGPTQVKGGNAALALGRASRVREALLFAGVSQGRILDEGCWAGDSAGNSLPARGVVITLNRQSQS